MIIITRAEYERRLKQIFNQTYQLMFDKAGMNVPDNEYDNHCLILEPIEDFLKAYRKQHKDA